MAVMPRAILHHGRATYPPLIDSRWMEEHGEVIADEFYTSKIILALPGTPGDYDEETHTRPEVPGAILYEGPGRIQSIGTGDESSVEVAGQTVTLTRYRVSYPLREALVPIGTKIEIRDESIKIAGQSKVEVVVTAYSINSVKFETSVLVESNQG